MTENGSCPLILGHMNETSTTELEQFKKIISKIRNTVNLLPKVAFPRALDFLTKDGRCNLMCEEGVQL